MNSLILVQNQLALQATDTLKSSLGREVNSTVSRPCFTIVSKKYGGTGADTLVSILSWAFEYSGLSPAVFQGGGTKGLLCRALDAALFSRVPLDNPALQEKLASFIGDNLQRPAFAMIDPSMNANTLGIISSIVEAQLGVDFRIIHLVRAPGEEANFVQAARQIGIPATIATLEPVFIDDEDEFADILLIPRLPDKMIQAMESDNLMFSKAFKNADFGSAAILRPKLQRFLKILGKFYG